MTRRIKGVIFDLWQTLITSTVPHMTSDLIGCLMRIPDFGEEKRGPLRREMLTHPFRGVKAVSQYLSQRTGRPELSPGDLRRVERSLKEEIDSVTVFPDVIPSLDYLRRDQITLALLSNISSPYVLSITKSGLYHYFTLLGQSCYLGCQKPEPESYRWVLNVLKLKPDEVLMVGDSLPNDVLAPRALGIESYHLNREGTSFYPYTIRSLEEVLRLV